MKIETIKTPTTEVYLEAEGFSVTVTNWANCEGANVICTGKELALRAALSMRWEELDLLMAAIAAARATP